MKKLLSVISICLVLSSYSQSRVHFDEIYDNEDSSLVYYGDKLFTGVVYDTYPNGQLKYTTNYTNGVDDGLQQEWYESGQLQSQSYFKEGKLDGKVQEWYENGQLKYEFNIKDGDFDGLYQEWYENGQVESQTSFKEGKKDGFYQEWYEDGALIFQEYYKDGVQIKPQLPEELQGLGIELDHLNETEFGLQECYAFYGNAAFDLEAEAIMSDIEYMSTIGLPFLFETDEEKVFEFELPGLSGILSLNKNFDRLAIIYTRHPEQEND